ncbi:hypothetical protein D8B26_005270 [Coccidioides posadasii str. Silveira]|uniref:CHCH domain-containing protein n=2 Tax=Coccidioides posadasii TaxID=199306 RepID=A0A0J6F7K1_COCPO|nr:CHCH domain containing protein [Coccidioides posadasii C735 delta SOWgp]EER24413.1 CHCH domain containing protein [Coccidioides posadasii C735 delta SOWgp]KMM66123.1 hypothetical protein CPAG_02463 [Coccidioides posadasii RMSCC 3488]QVM10615.1 hypothetical protein D8B26_005270 [Coccidioides posadasii str. Silveira]|eukprot:XP_003066558.1 CHCH domain containing protein [Coccidioides posadasii C735 delta SOWgp]
MARQRRGAAPTPARRAPARPTPAPAAPAQTQHRASSTAAAPPPAAPAAQQAAPPQAVQQSQGPGLFAQMASTAAGVAVGSSIGHAVGSFFTGGSSSAPAEAAQAPPASSAPMDNSLYQSNSSSWGQSQACETDIKAFRTCMDEHSGNMSICGWYLDQLKACQEAAKQY